MAEHQDSFDRVFPVGDLLKGRALRATIWGIVAGVALFLALTCLLLLVGLFEHRGALQIPLANFDEFMSVAGFESKTATDDPVPYANEGLLPPVWQSRGRLPGFVAKHLYRRVTVFRKTSSASKGLIICVFVLGLIWALAVAANHRASSAASRQSGDRLRKGIHRQALRLAPSNINNEGANEALELFLDRTEKVQSGLGRWMNVLTRDVPEVTAVALFLVLIQWRIGLLCLIPIAICIYVLYEIAKVYDQSDRLAMDQARGELKLLSESLKKSRLVRAYGMEDYEQTQFTETLDRYSAKVGDLNRGKRTHRMFAQLTILIVSLVVLYLSLIHI